MDTSGRYQSKLFSFFSEQSLRLRDKTAETWRKVKIAATWSAQIVLYPIYLAFQSTRLVGKQLRQTVRQVLPQLRAAQQAIQNPDLASTSPAAIAPSSDTPIQNILQAAIHLTQTLPASALPEPLGGQEAHPTRVLSPSSLIPPASSLSTQPTPHSSSPLTPRATPTLREHSSLLQGIASLLDTRSLVLVSTDNQLLDILTPDQQTQLYRRMIWELADYYHQQKALGLKRPAALKSLVVNNFLPLPADRPNALLPIRLFYGLMAWMQTSPVAIAANLFQESQLASLHAAKLSDSPLVQEAPQLPAPSGDAVGDGLRSAELPWLSLKDIFKGLTDRTSVQKRATQRLSPSLLARFLDWLNPAAIELSTVGNPSGITSDSLPQTQPDRTPWLTLEDLFGRIQPFQKWDSTSESWELHDTAQANRLIKHRASALKTAASAQPVSTSRTTTTVSKAPPIAETDPALSMTTLEAEVSLVTYVRHPLEQVLEWLDRGMLWIEERIARLLEWWRDRLKGED